MSGLKNIGTLQIEQDLPFQHKSWKVERVAWIVFFIALVMAALGLGGGVGPLNQASAVNGQIEIQYKPFARRVAPTDIEITLKSISGDTAELIVERDFINEYQIQKITPEPSDVKSGGNMLVYEFSVPEGATEMDIHFSLEPDARTVGNVSGRIGPSGHALITINQLVYP